MPHDDGGVNGFLLPSAKRCQVPFLDDHQEVASRATRRSSPLYGEGGNGGDDDQDILWGVIQKLNENSNNINPMEIRVDATLASCYGLCRFLIFDISTGAKDMPGWQLTDFIMLGGAFSSCIILSLLWSVVGIWTEIFNYDTANNEIIWNVASTAAIVGPLWLFMEIIFGWPPGGAMIHPDLLDFASDASLYHIYTIVTGTVGLTSIMCLNKLFASGSGWR